MMMQRTAMQAIVATALVLVAGNAIAADAGKVIFATGEVSAERDPVVFLAKGEVVLDNDTIATGDASRAQLLMLDNAKIALRPNSRLKIDEYLFQDATDDDSGEVIAVSGDRSVATLIKGGLRTITGAIGKEDESAYEVRTAVGVLGIRGTEYFAVFCNADCDWVPGVNANAPIEDGLYLGVLDGAIFFRNENGNIELEAGEYAFIPLAGRVPQLLDVPPPVLLDDNDLAFDADTVAGSPRPDDDGSASGFDSKLGERRSPDPDSSAPDSGETTEQETDVPAQPIIGTDPAGNPVDLTPADPPRPPGNRTIGYATGPLGRADTVYSATLDNDPTQYAVDANGDLTRFAGTYPGATGPVTADLNIGTAANVESGSDATTVLRWGRWAGGIAVANVPASPPDMIDLNAQSLHWIQSGDNTVPVMPITGTANYSLLGATSPTDNLGNTGVLGDASFLADFTNMRVDSTLTIDINATTWTATGTGDIGGAVGLPAHLFGGNYQNVTVGGVAGGNGVFSGFFSAPGPSSDPTFPGGVGLTYSIQDGAGTTTVSGAAAFGNP